MTRISSDEFRRFVASLQGQTLHTAARKRPFTVRVDEKGFVYTPLTTGRERPHRNNRIEFYLDRYAEHPSLHPGDFRETSVNASYMLTLIGMYVRSRNAGGGMPS